MHHKTGGSGAGISTDSGIPDFRGPQGVWTQNPKAQASSNIQNWVADAAVRRSVWESLGRDHVEQVPRPNPGHRALLALERRGVLTALVTQNIDGLHSEAGHLLVNLGKWVSGFSRFSDFQFFDFGRIILSKSGFGISKKNNKGVLGKPWTQRRVLRAISNTLKFQYFRKS